MKVNLVRLSTAAFCRRRRVPDTGGSVTARQMSWMTRTTVDEVRYSEDKDGQSRQQRRGGQDARLVAIATEVTDGQNDNHVADVVDVPDESRQRAGQSEAALDLRNDRRVVSKADAGDDPEHRDGCSE